ncbi:glycosyltransferase [Pseudalkalibacillus caeni]|uniref:Glycosyltransferase n=1 Tax=Exobacillus caeni TaxID=2574798 RepID=A0A5R9F481_9BACL|nr:glycosyltransferase [Pseudalkalibacillus caeni]TLS38492.1 glycosyltransferase [Pseudalkalibacillus caeni]
MVQNKPETLILVTHRFPYPPGEEFLANELEYLCQEFETVHIIPINNKDIKMKVQRPLPENVTVHSFFPLNSYGKRVSNFLSDPKAYKWFRKDFKRAKAAGPRGLLVLMNWISAALRVEKYLENTFLKKKKENLVFYSYWMNPGAIALAMLRDRYNVAAVTRAHGGDLYEYRQTPQYLPLQQTVIQKLDKVYLISSDGQKYLASKYKGAAEKLDVSRLGTNKVDNLASKSQDSTLRIISCSYINPVKRIDLLVKALQQCKINIEWRHIGDGDLKEQIQQEAESLPENVKYNFLGGLPNEKVLENYKTEKTDLFINVSSSEGIPVTIMEAFSFGIPVMATNVGGTAELVNNNNGILLEKNISPENLAQKITEFGLLSKEVKEAKGENAYQTWKEMYSASKNYATFAKELKAMGERYER